MRRRDLSTTLLGTAAGAFALPSAAAAAAAATAQGAGKAARPGSGQRTRAEIELQVTPTDYSYPADPYIDPRRYGADPTGHNDSTAAMQTAINVANACRGTIWIGNDCGYLCGALSLTMKGNRNSSGLRIMGSSVNGSRLIQKGTPEAILTFVGASPDEYPQETHLVLENFSILCSGKSTDAIVLHGMSAFSIRKIHINGARRSIWLHFALTGVIEDCWLTGGTYGVYANAQGQAAGNYLVTLRNCIIGPHSSWGIDFDAGDRLKLEACDLEENGTPGRLDTGALILRSNFGHATGYATADLDGCWFEANHGQAVSVEANGRLTLAIRNTNWYASEKGNSLLVASASAVSIEDSNAPTAAGDIWNITAGALFLKNVTAHTIIDTGVRLPTYFSVITSEGDFGTGRRDAFVGKLGNGDDFKVNILQQCDEVELSFSGSLPSTGDPNGWTITGLPARYRPKHEFVGTAVVQVGSVDRVVACRVAASTGNITIGRSTDMARAAGFSVAGQIHLRIQP